jgi:Asp-tRNA(Asn)/Glu-tRNA(Gln) amidotransferase C subunit
MAYIQPSGVAPLSTEQVEALARLAGVQVPPEDLMPLAAALANQIASIARLDQLDLARVNPILEFDPRWPDTEA